MQKHKYLGMRIVAIFLSIITVLNIIITVLNIESVVNVYAAEVDGNGNSQGSSGSIGAVGYGSGGFLKANQGYRFYIVDNNFNRVTDVYDFTFTTPNANKMLTNSRFENVSNNTSYWHRESIDDLASKVQGSKDASAIKSIYPLEIMEGANGKFIPHGSDFRQWFIGSGGGSVGTNHTDVSGGSTSSGSSKPSSGSGNTSSGSKPSSSGSSSIVSGSGYQSYNDLPETFKANVTKFNGLLMDVNSAVQNKIDNAKTKSDQTAIKNLYDERSTAYTKFLNFINTYFKAGYYPAADNDQVARAAAGAIITYYTGHGSFSNSDARILGNYCYARYRGNAGVFPYNKEYSKSEANYSNLLDSQIPLAGTVRYPAEILLLGKEFVPSGFSVDVTGDGNVTGIDALKYRENGQYKYYLIVEPLISLGITNSSNQVILRAYGSYYNIVQLWASIAKNDNAYLINRAFMKQYGKRSLIVAQSYPGLTRIKPVAENSISLDALTVSQNLRLMEDGIGIGMHIYCASDFDESGTHTYDPLLGTTPGPAPDPSDLPQDSPDKGGNTITIIKNYVTETNGTEQTDGNYTRVKNPHTIEIEDEPNYKVVEWNTSTKEAPSIPNGSKTPWSTLIQTSTKTNTGTTPTAVELSNKEKVMYIKLKKADGISENPEVSGDWVLNESELTTSVSSKQATIFLHKI